MIIIRGKRFDHGINNQSPRSKKWREYGTRISYRKWDRYALINFFGCFEHHAEGISQSLIFIQKHWNKPRTKPMVIVIDLSNCSFLDPAWNCGLFCHLLAYCSAHQYFLIPPPQHVSTPDSIKSWPKIAFGFKKNKLSLVFPKK